MRNSSKELRQKLNRVARMVGLFSLVQFVVFGLLLTALTPYVSLEELPPVVALVVIFAGVFALLFPVWWVSDRMRRRLGLVCGTCGAWLSFRNSEHGECHRGHHQQHSKDAN